MYGENNISSKNSEISFDEHVINKLKSNNISISYSLKEHLNAEPFKNSVLRIIVPAISFAKMIGVLILLSYQKENLMKK